MLLVMMRSLYLTAQASELHETIIAGFESVTFLENWGDVS